MGRAGPVTQAPVTVVEVWATWCAPCLESFPELTRLQAEYGERVRVVALTDDPATRVKPYVAKHPELGFAVAVTSSRTLQSFMFGGFEGRGMPSTYVIKDGEMLWSGEPAGLEAALKVHLPEAAPAAD